MDAIIFDSFSISSKKILCFEEYSLWVVMLCGLEKVLCFRGASSFIQTARHNNPEDSNLHSHRCENLESQTLCFV
jgi:hypothetical protein